MPVDSRGKTDFQQYDFESPLRRRLVSVAGIGDQANAYAESVNNRKKQAQEFSDNLKQNNAVITSLGRGSSNYNQLSGAAKRYMEKLYQQGSALEQSDASRTFDVTPSYTPVGGQGNNPDSFINAIASQESGGNYGVVNSSSGALGKYQIMPSNVASWSREALGHAITPGQFLKSPQLQDKIATYQLRNYYEKYGPAGGAVAWYAGPGAAQSYVNSGRISNSSQGAYPSINAYAQSILRKMGLA